jgi:hypothetical protein
MIEVKPDLLVKAQSFHPFFEPLQESWGSSMVAGKRAIGSGGTTRDPGSRKGASSRSRNSQAVA